MFISYLEQLTTIAEETGWELREAVIDAGFSESSYYRWIKGRTKPQAEQTEAVIGYMLKYAK